MKRHWLIRYNNVTRYVPVYDIWEKQIEQVISYCHSKGYDLNKVFVIETSVRHVYSNILKV